MAHLALQLRARRGDFSLAIDDALELEGITALFGPSGSGKSTLLRIIAGLDTHAAGHIRFDGETWHRNGSRVAAHRRGVTLLFQDVRLFPHLDVAGNLDYAAKRASARREGAGRRDVVRSLGLEPLLSRRTQTLSGGEAQRVAIARALLARPRLLLMDEPLAALDIGRRAQLLTRIEELPRRFGIPVLYVTHAIDEVARLADHTVLMQNGRWIARGDTASILERLDLPELRAGTGALLQATVSRHDAALALTELEVGSWTLSVPRLEQDIGTSVRLRVSARDVALATARPTGISIRNVLEGRVLDITTDNRSAYAEVLLDADGHHLRARITRASVTELGLSTGTRVYALIKSIALDA